MDTQPFGSPEERAAKRVEEYNALLWHAATYVIVNAFLWIVVPGGAFWVTIGWGIGMAFHLAAYFIGEPGPDSARYQRYLDEERAKEHPDPA